MQITAFLFRKPKQPLIQKRHLAQQKIDQLDQQLRIVATICPNQAHLQTLKTKLHNEREKWLSELKQAELSLVPVRRGLAQRFHQSGLPP
jgi:hypothetical protein